MGTRPDWIGENKDGTSYRYFHIASIQSGRHTACEMEEATAILIDNVMNTTQICRQH